MKRAQKVLIALLTVALILCNFTGSLITAKAEQIYTNTATSINFVGTVQDITGVPGETTHVKLPVRANGGYIRDPKITVNTDGMPFTVSNITYTADGYSAQNPPLGISDYQTSYIEFDVKVKETATISKNKLAIKIEFTAQDLSDGSNDLFSLDVPSIYFIIDSEKEPAQLTVDHIVFDNAYVGNDAKLSFVIKNEGEITSKNTYFSIDGYKDAGIIPGYSKLSQEVGTDGKLASGESDKITLPVTISSLATAGNKTLTINMTYKDADGEKYTESTSIYITIKENSLAPNVVIESTKYASELKAGDEFNLVTTLCNEGLSTATEIEVIAEGLGTTSFLPNYTSKSITVADLEFNEKVDVKIPLIVSKEAAAGLKEVPITINYKDDAGLAKTTSTKLYLEIVSGDGVDSTGKPNVVVSNVDQSIANPNAGERIDISFDLENKSNIDISEIKIAPTNLSNANFSPVDSEPYQYIDLLKGGKKKRITIPLIISKTITEGTNNLEISYEYKDSNGKTWTDNKATVYVLNIQNEGAAASKPKLIISNFTTDQEELRAGSTFNFIFDIKNTHSITAASNIKVTVSQAENIFTVTSGSNSFYITQIPAGETVQNKLELKVKSDAVTKAYPVEITIEYEYDGAEANPTTGQIGETVKETINLQAIENSRPVVNNIYVGSYDMPTINQPTALTFEFYNMGKSALNNVYATVEGDFTLTTGNMYFIGNVEAGSSQYAELEVIPNLEGTAKGKLIITFEDSNGDEVKIDKEFEATVQGEVIPVIDGNMGGDMQVIDNLAKKPILPVWAFIVLQIVILLVAVPVTRKMKLGLYRRKLRKQEEAE